MNLFLKKLVLIEFLSIAQRNVMVLCVDCHKKTSNYGMRNKKRLKVNMEAKSKHGS